MVYRVVLKRLTEKSDLGWFHSIHDKRDLAGHQKGITLNKQIINGIWPNLLVRQSEYNAAKAAEKAAQTTGGAGLAVAAIEKGKAQAAGHLPINVEIYGPAGKPMLHFANRLMALQDKNWRLNGAFIEEPPTDPDRFDSALQDGDLALIAFDGVEWPTRAVVVLLAQSTVDAILMADLVPLVKRGARSMVELTPADLQTLADKHGLGANHVVRTMAVDPVIEAALEEIAQGNIAAAATVRQRRPNKPITAEEHATAIAKNTITGQLGEQMVNGLLCAEHSSGGPAYRWMWPESAAHPYDFETLNTAGSPDTVIDAKSTSSVWTIDFFISSAELAYAATSPFPYVIFRLSEVGPTGAWLRRSNDIRPFAKTVMAALTAAAPPGTRVISIAVSPDASGLTWSDPPERLPAWPSDNGTDHRSAL